MIFKRYYNKFQYLCSAIETKNLSHINNKTNTSQMVNISNKNISQRVAIAVGSIIIPSYIKEYINMNDSIYNWTSKKGPIINTAVTAGTLAVKKTWDLIPFCHPLLIEKCDFRFASNVDEVTDNIVLDIECEVSVSHKTGVEMEALTGVSVACLTIYDMLKALSHDIRIENIQLKHKSGGRSGEYNRK